MENASEIPGSEIPATNGHTKHGDEEKEIKVKILEALFALQRGDFTVRLPYHWGGIDGRLADVFNS